MSSKIYEKVRANPRFAELAKKRSRFALSLTALVLVAYYTLMMFVAFAPDVLRTPIFEGGTLSVAIPFGASIIIGGWLLTGWYVRRANTEFDALNQQIGQEASK